MSRVVMSREVSGLFTVLGAATVALLLGACGSSPPPQSQPPTPPSASSAPAAAEAPTCVDDKDQRVQCLSDSDCCPKFVCGKDPDLSQSVNYCVFGG